MPGSKTWERGEGTKVGSSIGEIEADNGDQKRGSQMHGNTVLPTRESVRNENVRLRHATRDDPSWR